MDVGIATAACTLKFLVAFLTAPSGPSIRSQALWVCVQASAASHPVHAVCAAPACRVVLPQVMEFSKKYVLENGPIVLELDTYRCAGDG